MYLCIYSYTHTYTRKEGNQNSTLKMSNTNGAMEKLINKKYKTKKNKKMAKVFPYHNYIKYKNIKLSNLEIENKVMKQEDGQGHLSGSVG